MRKAIGDKYRNADGHLRWDECPDCDGLKLLRSRLCRDCAIDDRLRVALGKLPPKGHFDYFPRNGRYYLVGVSGFGRSSKTASVTLLVLDSAWCGQVVRKVRTKIHLAEPQRAELLAWVKEENRIDREFDKRQAA